MSFGVTIRHHGSRPSEGWCCCSHGAATWSFHEEADALRFAARLLELQPGARVQLRCDAVFGQLGFRWLLALGVRVDGEEADAIAWNVAYQGALAREEQLRVALLPADEAA